MMTPPHIYLDVDSRPPLPHPQHRSSSRDLTHRCRRKKSLVPVDDSAYGPDLAKKTMTMAIKADEKGGRCWEEPACPSNCISGDKRKNGVREGGGSEREVWRKEDREGREGGRRNIRTAILSHKGMGASIFCSPNGFRRK